MVRPRERERHEYVDSSESEQVRSCLYMGGQGTHILLVRGWTCRVDMDVVDWLFAFVIC